MERVVADFHCEASVSDSVSSVLSNNPSMISLKVSPFVPRCRRPVGAYFRNEWWRVRQTDEQRYSRIYHRRNASENLHSILKDQLLMDKNLNVKGYDAIEKYIEQFMLTLTYVAFTRVENGVTDGLTRVNPTAFN
jgi:hypothetical protein